MTTLCDQTHTRLEAEGSEYVISAILDAISNANDIGLMELFIPTPPIIQLLPSELVGKWEKEYWGEILGDYDTEIVKRSPGSVTFDFWSWYNPLLDGLEKISAKFPTITLRGSYAQLRGFETGTYIIKDGEIVSFDRHTSDDDDKLRDMMYSWSEGGKEQWIEFTNNLLARPGMSFV